ncbi:MAG: glycosyltransferase [Alphaproteobacteria bacterium]|nr:glycosyltransferase [Alphaproteobacteria bacterium]
MWSNLVLALALSLAAASLVGALYLVAAGLAVRRFAARAPLPPAARPPVTILKPLRGDDPELYENLRSFCCQDYPAAQVIFGVGEAGDPARSVVERLIAELPGADLELVVDDRRHGTNHKIGNLHNMLAAARHPVILVADSDMRVGPGYLDAIMGELERAGVGLVTCLYVGRPMAGLWSRMGAMFINQGFLPSVLLAGWIGARAGCFGATVALRRETLERIGGFLAFRDHLADDHAMGEAVRALGLRVALARYVVDDMVEEPAFPHLFRHELRWARTVGAIAPVGFAASAVTHGVALALLALPFALLLPWVAACLPVTVACRIWMIRAVDRALRLTPTPLWLIGIRDPLSFLVLVASFCGRTVTWRGGRFRVGANGRLVPHGDPER